MTKKVVFIDWNKTLSYSLFWEHLQDKKHPNHQHLPAIEKWLFVDNRDVINPWMRGEFSAEDISSKISQDTGINSDVILGELRRSCEEMCYSIDDLEDIIGRLQASGIKVVIATDNMDTFSRFTVPAMRLDAVFDGILSSYDIGYLKDDDRPEDSLPFFDEYLAKNGWNYADAILLDDSPDKSGKYKRLGFERVPIDSPEVLRVTLERLVDAR
jgi:hypothetical protein